MQEIYKLRPDIKEKVEHAYPVTKQESKCKMEKRKREYLREQEAKKLYDKPEQ